MNPFRKLSRSAVRQYLQSQLLQMPGLPAKAAQWFGGSDGQSPRQALPISIVTAEISKRQPHLAASLRWIDPHGQAASLGQVHRAQLIDGQWVAIKVLYPGIEASLESQIKWMVRLAKRSPAARYGFDSDGFRQFLQSALAKEMDYAQEASHQRAFAAWSREYPWVVVPAVLDEYSNQSVLVQTFEPSERFAAVPSPSDRLRWRVAESLGVFLLSNLFLHGRLHADLHPGNWGVRSDEGRVVVYDFGSVLELSPETVGVLWQWIASHQQGNPYPAFDVFVALGFCPKKLLPLEKALPALAASILKPFVDPRPWLPKKGELKQELDAMVGKDKWWFRTAGPAWFALFLRGLSWWSQSVEAVDSPIEMVTLLGSLSGSRKPDRPRVDIPRCLARDLLVPNQPAECLRVQVTRNNESLIDLEMPVRSIDRLEEVVPPSVVDLLPTMGVSLAHVRERAQRGGYLPQRLLSVEIGEKTVTLWLE